MIFNWLSISLIVLTIVWFIFFIISFNTGEFIMPLFLAGVIILGGMGWLAFGHICKAIPLEKEVIVKVIVLPNSIILTDNDVPVKTIIDIPSYNKYKGVTNVTLIGTGWVDIYYNTNWNNAKYYTIKD